MQPGGRPMKLAVHLVNALPCCSRGRRRPKGRDRGADRL